MRKLFLEQRGSLVLVDEPRVDYVHEDRYASLGLAVMHRSPIAFYPDADREALAGDYAPVFPLALSLSEAAEQIALL